MKKIFGASVLLAAVVYVGFKGVVWYEARQAMEQLRDVLGPYSALEYGWISSSIDGEVRVRDVRLTPFRLKETIAIDALVVKAPDAMALLRLGLDHRDKKTPESLAWRVEGARMGLSSPVLEDFVTDPFNQALTKVACGDLETIGPQVWKRLGYEQLSADLEGSYRLDRTDQSIQVELKATMQAMSSLDLDVVFKLPENGVGLDEQPVNHPPRLVSLRFGYQDESYQSRLAHFCRRRMELKETEYVQRSVRAWEQAMANVGIGVTEELKQAYRLWLEGDKRLLIEMNPKQAVDYAALPFIQPSEAMEQLGLTVRVGSYPVRDLVVTWDKTRFNAVTDPAPPSEETITRPAKPTPPKVQVAFKLTEFEQLERYLDYPIRLNAIDGRLYEGKLVSVQEQGVEVGAQVSGGLITYPIRKSDIATVEVYRE